MDGGSNRPKPYCLCNIQKGGRATGDSRAAVVALRKSQFGLQRGWRRRGGEF